MADQRPTTLSDLFGFVGNDVMAERPSLREGAARRRGQGEAEEGQGVDAEGEGL